MSKKLLIISQRFWPEENDINEIAAFFASVGVKVDVLCGKPNYPEGEFYKGYSAFKNKQEQYGDITLYRAAEIKKQGFLGKRPLLNYVSFGISSLFRIRKLKQNQYDAVFIYQTSPVFLGRAGLKLASKRRIRSVMYVRDLWPDAIYKEMNIKDPILRKIFKVISYRQYKRAGRLITSSKDVQRFLVNEIAESPQKVVYAAPFASSAYSPGLRVDKIKQRFMGSFNLLYIGEIEEGGPVDMFMEASHFLIGAGFRDIRFILIGSGQGIEDYKKQIDRQGLYDMFFFEGRKEKKELKGYIEACDVLICADKIDVSISYEPPKQIIDYLAAGKPILAAVDGEGKDIIRKASCGLVSTPEDAREFSENILKLYKSPKEKLSEMGDRAQLYRIKNFSFEAFASGIMDVIFPQE